jgi:hypothetical protein
MSKTSKSNPEKGLRTVSIEFAGKTRKLFFSHAIIGDFEAEANQILRALGIGRGGMLLADNLMATDENGMITGYIAIAKIQSLALYYALKSDDPAISMDIIDGKAATYAEDGKVKTDAIHGAIDAYIENGGTVVDLMRKVVTAYGYATNPSIVASLQRKWQISEDRLKVLTEADNERLTTIEKAISDVRAKQTPGLPSTDSPS